MGAMDLNDAAKLAGLYMGLHKLGDWQFRFDRATRRFGCCNHKSKTISLSTVLVGLNDKREVRDTILHEIAHALAGPKVRAHGREWREIALRIGCNGRRCYGDEVLSLAGNER
jgi:predicted SprT family Zn-dependent metalloprotease